jgi:hypothetical protein
MALLEQQRRLETIFKQLSPQHKETILSFAEFLFAQTSQAEPVKPQIKPRPPNESVIAAIKRLSQSYPMLDKAKMLDETSTLMSEHILKGRDSVEIIDELEAVFLRHYRNFTEKIT